MTVHDSPHLRPNSTFSYSLVELSPKRGDLYGSRTVAGIGAVVMRRCDEVTQLGTSMSLSAAEAASQSESAGSLIEIFEEEGRFHGTIPDSERI